MSQLARTVLFCFLFTGFFLFSRFPLLGQSSLSYGWYINVNGGITQLHGDIQEDDNPLNKLAHESSAGGGIKFGKYINPLFTVNLHLHGSQLIGQNETRDLQFLSDMVQFQLGLTLNATNLVFGKKERRVNLYGTAGAGVVFYRSVAYQLSTNVPVTDFGYLGSGNRLEFPNYNTYYFPLGAGLDFKLSKRWYLNLETTAGIFLNDQLDATVKGQSNDACHYTSLGLTYYFKERKKGRIPQSRPLEEKPEIVAEPFANEYVNLVYRLPEVVSSFDVFDLKSEIHKGKIDGAATLTQVLPVGFYVLDTAIAGAKTDFNMFTLRLNWDELPSDSVFTVSYKVKVDRIFGVLPMASILFFGKTGKEFKFRTTINVLQREEPVVQKEPAPEIIAKDTIPTIPMIEYRLQVSASFKAKIPLRDLNKKVTPTEEIREDFQNNWYTYTVGSFKTYDDAKKYMMKRVEEYGLKDAFIVVFYKGKKLKSLSDLKLYVPEEFPVQPVVKKDEFCYRVQILAVMGQSVDPQSLEKKYGLQQDVNEEIYHNWHKYTVGPCSPKATALQLLKQVQASGVSGAFIVTYKNGERVIAR